MKIHYTVLFLFLVLIACQPNSETSDPFQHIKGEKLKEVLQKSMDAAGGLDNWQQLNSLKFKKDYRLLKESGEIENAALQTHHYTFSPEREIRISWQDTTNQQHQILSLNNSVSKVVNGQKDESAKQQSLINTVLSSTFVISIPFNLLDPGVELSYEGTDDFDGKQAHVVKAVYNPDTHDSHSTPDTWWHYFDTNNYKQLGYMVFHVDHFSLVKNLSDTKVGPFTFVHKRDSYRADSLRNILYLRADYEYTDYEVD